MTATSILPKHARQFFIPGPVGKIDCLELSPPSATIRGLALIFHPNPIEGGSYTNKVVQTIASALNYHGYVCFCPNLRGVGLSDGTHDFGVGELEDAHSIYDYIRMHHKNGATITSNHDLPIVLAGFSFGSAVASQLAHIRPHSKLILVGPAVTRYKVVVPNNEQTIVIQGDNDEIIEPNAVLAWGREHNQIISLFPHTGHFFHGRLTQLKNFIYNIRL